MVYRIYDYRDMKPSLTKVLLVLLLTSLVIATTIFIALNLYKKNQLHIKQISVQDRIIKGESLDIEIEFQITQSKNIKIQKLELMLNSVNYSFKEYFEINLTNHILTNKKNNLKGSLGPLLVAKEGVFALNVGIYFIEKVRIVYEQKISIERELNCSFIVQNPKIQERINNGDYSNQIDEWDIDYDPSIVELSISEESPIGYGTLTVKSMKKETIKNKTLCTLSQQINTSQTHFLEFKTKVEGENNQVEVALVLDNISTNSLILDEKSSISQKIFYGKSQSIKNITLSIKGKNIDEYFKFYIDQISIKAYENRIFVAIMNDNWIYHNNEIIRNSTFKAIRDASLHFQEQFGIKLIPLVEVKWEINITDPVIKLGEIHDKAIKDAKILFKLKQSWDTTNGRSPNNNGFDILNCFTNRTGAHFGFIYGGENVAFHFAQSAYLQEAIDSAGYGYIQITVLDEWAESLVQHEVSHVFGALDRDSSIYPPSVMSKALSSEQVIEDVLQGNLWLQLNNWILEDSFLILEKRNNFK